MTKVQVLKSDIIYALEQTLYRSHGYYLSTRGIANYVGKHFDDLEEIFSDKKAKIKFLNELKQIDEYVEDISDIYNTSLSEIIWQLVSYLIYKLKMYA
jgi:hypothetical protein